MGVNTTTIVYLRVLIIQIGSTITLMAVEAQGIYIYNIRFLVQSASLNNKQRQQKCQHPKEMRHSQHRKSDEISHGYRESDTLATLRAW